MEGRDGQPFHFLYFQLTAGSWKLIWLRGLNLYFGRFAISNNAFKKKALHCSLMQTSVIVAGHINLWWNVNTVSFYFTAAVAHRTQERAACARVWWFCLFLLWHSSKIVLTSLEQIVLLLLSQSRVEIPGSALHESWHFVVGERLLSQGTASGSVKSRRLFPQYIENIPGFILPIEDLVSSRLSKWSGEWIFP